MDSAVTAEEKIKKVEELLSSHGKTQLCCLINGGWSCVRCGRALCVDHDKEDSLKSRQARNKDCCLDVICYECLSKGAICSFCEQKELTNQPNPFRD